jgi:hypothetical protein
MQITRAIHSTVTSVKSAVAHTSGGYSENNNFSPKTKGLYKTALLPVACMVAKCAFFFSGLNMHYKQSISWTN